MAALDRLGPRRVAGQPVALEHLGEVVSNAVLSHGRRLAYAGSVGLAISNAALDGVAVGLRCESGRISAIGPGVGPEPGDEVIDGAGLALVPGLVNAHTHAAMTLFRGFADDLPLMEWLTEHIWPVEKRMDDEDVYWGTRLACVEMIRTGTTCFWDMYWHAHATARAVEDAGLRAVTAAPLIDDCDESKSERACGDADRSLEQISGAGGELALPGFAPHAIYSVSERSLRWVADRSAELDLPVQIHLSETSDEVEGCVAERDERPASYLDRVGLLGPRTVLAHGTWLNRDELDLIADRGATVVTNPVANLKLAVGRVFPYIEARAAGVELGLGTDGPGSNNSLDLLADAKVFALLQKNEARDPAAVTAAETLEIATGRRSGLLGGRGFEVGAPADFLLVRADEPELAMGELDAGLVYAASGSIVDTTVVAGRALMRAGTVEGEGEVVARARERAARLGLSG
jgi:5-methylthioadenosine/S-adenosylhomocysteine deaminase